MTQIYSDAEHEAAQEWARQLLGLDAVTDTRQAEPELTDEQLLQQELARPTERTNTRICREHAEDKARRAAERKAETMEQQLEARLRRLIAEGREAGFKALGEVLEVLARNEKGCRATGKDRRHARARRRFGTGCRHQPQRRTDADALGWHDINARQDYCPSQ